MSAKISNSTIILLTYVQLLQGESRLRRRRFLPVNGRAEHVKFSSAYRRSQCFHRSAHRRWQNFRSGIRRTGLRNLVCNRSSSPVEVPCTSRCSAKTRSAAIKQPIILKEMARTRFRPFPGRYGAHFRTFLKALTDSRRVFGLIFCASLKVSAQTRTENMICSVALSPIIAGGPQSCGFAVSSSGNTGPRSRNTSMKFVKLESSKGASLQTRTKVLNREVRFLRLCAREAFCRDMPHGTPNLRRCFRARICDVKGLESNDPPEARADA